MNNDIVLVPSRSAYRIPNGNYAVIQKTKAIRWFACREAFHNHFMFWMSSFYYSLDKDQRAAFVDFISQVENKIGVRDTVISRTNLPNVLHIKPGQFWMAQRLRLSLFTILLRAATRHKEGNTFKHTMLAEPYLARTYKAVKMFMAGRTRYTGWGSGWVDVFGAYCGHRTYKRMRHQRRLKTLLVPDWQVFPFHLLARFGRWIKRLTHRAKKTIDTPGQKK